jgi:hypothetical protein
LAILGGNKKYVYNFSRKSQTRKNSSEDNIEISLKEFVFNGSSSPFRALDSYPVP